MYDKYKATGALTAVLPRWFTTVGIDQAGLPEMPYAVCFTLIETPEYTFDTTRPIDTLPLQVSIFEQSSRPDTILDIGTKLKAAFDYTTLTVPGFTSVRVLRAGSSLEDDEDGVNHLWVQYNVITQKD